MKSNRETVCLTKRHIYNILKKVEIHPMNFNSADEYDYVMSGIKSFKERYARRL